MAPDELTREKAEELLATPSGDRELGLDPATGRQVVARAGRYGPYVSEVLEEGSAEKPRTGSLFKSMSLETVTLDDALRLLSLPRTLTAPDGEEIQVANGRYGPYIKKGSETRSLADEEQLFTVTAEEAVALLAQPKERRGRGQAKPPLKELGPDPSSGRPIVVKDGRFGPYVTDGETNASLRRGDDAESLTMDRALELLAERRAKGPARRSRAASPASADTRSRPILYRHLSGRRLRRAVGSASSPGRRNNGLLRPRCELVTATSGFRAWKYRANLHRVNGDCAHRGTRKD